MSDSSNSRDFEPRNSLLRKRKRRNVSPYTQRVLRRQINDSPTPERQLSHDEQLNLRRELEKSEDRVRRTRKLRSSLKRRNSNDRTSSRRLEPLGADDSYDKIRSLRIKKRFRELVEFPETGDRSGNSAEEPSTSSARVGELQRSSARSKLRFRTGKLENQFWRINSCKLDNALLETIAIYEVIIIEDSLFFKPNKNIKKVIMGNSSSQSPKQKVEDEPESFESKVRRMNPPQNHLKRPLSNLDNDISSKRSRSNDQEVPVNGASDWEDSTTQDSESYQSDSSSNDGKQVPSRFGSRSQSSDSLNDVSMTDLSSINKRPLNWANDYDQRSQRLRPSDRVNNNNSRSSESLNTNNEMNWTRLNLKRSNSSDDLPNKRPASGKNTPSGSPLLERLQRLKRHRSNSDDFDVNAKRLKRSVMIDRKRKGLYDEYSPKKRLRSDSQTE